MSSTLNVNLTLLVFHFNNNLDIADLQCCNYYHLLSDSLSKIHSSISIFHCKKAKMQNIPNIVSISSMNSIQISIIQNTICKFIHKKCHLKSYHYDIKYHWTLHTIFIAVLCFANWLREIVLNMTHKMTSLVENMAKKNRSRFPIAVLLTTLICSH
jgi:hypothetical protein